MLRIIGTIVLLFIEPMSKAFFMIYTFTGFTDAVDGFAARITNSITETGAKLDSIADLSFYTVMLIKICPLLLDVLPVKIWVTVGLILAVRLAAYVVSAVKHREFASVHTLLNKASTFMLFFVPYIIQTPYAVNYCWTICIIAALSSVEELMIHITKRKKESKQLEKV